MGGSVTFCKECGACNWAGKERCETCGGELEPTLRQVHAFYCATDPGFRRFVDEQRVKLGMDY